MAYNKKLNDFSIAEFMEKYGTDDLCLDKMFHLNFDNSNCPKCGSSVKAYYHRTKNRRSYQCQKCSQQLYPTKGTPLEKTTIPLSCWFYVLYLMATSDGSLTSKDIERNFNSCYKSSLRMMRLLKRLFADEFDVKLSGVVEVKECIVLKRSVRCWKWWSSTKTPRKSPIIGLLQRDGRVIVKHLENRKADTVEALIKRYVQEGSTIYTNTWSGYSKLKDKYKHEVIDSRNQEYVRGDIHINNISSMLAKVKKKLKRHQWISEKYLLEYCQEEVYKHNNSGMSKLEKFEELLGRTIGS